MRIKILCLSILLSLIFVFIMACDEETDYSQMDTRLWPESQLLKGSFLEQPSNTNNVQILHLVGDEYRRGYQHGYWLKDQIDSSISYLESDELWSLALAFVQVPFADIENKSMLEHGYNITYDFVKEECEGMVDGSNGVMDMDICIAMNSICFILEFLIPLAGGIPGMCSGLAMINDATEPMGGKLLHGRNLDWDAMDFILDYPTIIVSKPDGKYTNINVGWPGWISALTGMNEHKISVESNELTTDDQNLNGRSHLQMLKKILEEAASLDEALQIIEEEDHATSELFLITDGNTGEAAVVEMTGSHYAVRRMNADGVVTYQDGTEMNMENVLFVTNHAEDPTLLNALGKSTNFDNMGNDSYARYTRILERLTGQSRGGYDPLPTDNPAYSYGNLDVEEVILILRDPKDMRNRTNIPCENYNVFHSVGNNHNVQSFVFVPEDLQFWMAGGWDVDGPDVCGGNVLYSPFVGYDFNELVNGTHSGSLPIYDPAYTAYSP